MDKSHQFYLFLFSTAILFTDINPTGDLPNNWFHAQSYCKGQGLTIERDKSDQPYWTGLYRRLTPWINILGCYPGSFEALHKHMKKTMIRSSVGMCQEICQRADIDKFAIHMNDCFCIKSGNYINPNYRISPLSCDYKCEDKSDDIYPGDCGGRNAYNIYGIQKVNFVKEERCLSLQCSPDATHFSPHECVESLDRVCENMEKPDNGNANSWNVSMDECKNSHPPHYLLGNVRLDDPHHICNITFNRSQVFWIGVVRQIYTSIDQGLTIHSEDHDTFLKCQMCTNSKCDFKDCSELLNGSIFCKSKTTTSKRQTTVISTTSDEKTTIDEKDWLESINGTLQTSSDSDDSLKIALPVLIVLIISLLSAIAVVFYKRKKNMSKKERTVKAVVGSRPKTNIDSIVQNSSYFVLEQCSQKIQTVSCSPSESPYNNSEEGVYDHLRDKTSRKPEVEDTYQHATAGVSRDMSEYDTMANAVNKKQEEDASYDYSHQNAKGNYACDLRAKNNLTDNPYDVAV